MPQPTAQRSYPAALIGTVACLICAAASVTPARAQECAADCNGNDVVIVNELITAVRIALGQADVSTCPPADTDHNGMVVIGELIQGVNSALMGCGNSPTATVGSATPTATASSTPTETGSPGTCPEPGPPPPNCGNDRIEVPQGETCDDGSRSEGPGDPCPANCRILTCSRTGTTVMADIVFETNPEDLLISGLTVFVRYPDGRVDVPGSNADAAVQAAVSSEFFSITPNDLNYALTAVLIDPFFLGVNGGTAMTVALDLCCGEPPADTAFTCQVVDATDPDLNSVTDQVTCRVVLR